MIRLTGYLLIVLTTAFQLEAQLYNRAFISTESGATITINQSVINDGNWNNEGVVALSDDFMGSGDFHTVAGSIHLFGNNQNISDLGDSIRLLKISGGGIKTFDQDEIISTSLRLEKGILNINAVASLSIQGGSDSSYLVGTLQRGALDSLFFPIGTASEYRPIWAIQVAETDVLTAGFIDQSITGTAGNGLLEITNQGYWSILGATEPFKVLLPLDQATMEDHSMVVAGTNQPDIEWSTRGSILSSESEVLASTIPSTSQYYTYGQFFDEQLRIRDSLALVSLYDKLAGQSWIDSKGWLENDMDEWTGLSITNKRVTAVELPSNGLDGEMRFNSNALGDLAAINVAGNEITDLQGLNNLTSLKSLNISENRLQFGPIEEAISREVTVDYHSQKPVLDSIRIIREIGSTYNVNREVSGTSNHFTWYRNTIPYTETNSSFDVGVNSFADEGIFYAEVTSDVIPDLKLQTTPVWLLVSSLERDSASLLAMHTALNGSSWTKGSSWPNRPLREWEGLTIRSNRVVGLDLSASNISGRLPAFLLDVTELEVADFSDNRLTGIPNLNGLDEITSFDLSGNKLEFDDLEPNINVPGLNYQNQRRFGQAKETRLNAGMPHEMGFIVGGSQNKYSWKRNGVAIPNAANKNLMVPSIDYESMGEYVLEVTNPLVPNLVLRSEPQIVLAQSTIAISPYFRDFFGNINTLEDGEAYLFKINEPGQPYDTIDIVSFNKGAILFEDIVLDDYLVRVDSDLEVVEESNGSTATVKVLPTYWESTIDWVEADTIELRDQFSDSLRMQRLVEGNLGGFGIVGLTVESEFITESSLGRIETRRRVRKAGCSLRRNTRVGGGREEDEEEWELIAYQETDDEGEVSFGFLPAALYRLNIQYPGIPMDPNSFIEFEITQEEEKDGYQLNALITEEAITVSLVEDELALKGDYFEGLNVYPVPARDVVHIDYEKLSNQSVKLLLFNLEGRIVKEMKVNKGVAQSLELDVSENPDGVYLLRFVDESKEMGALVTYKIIIRK